MARPAFVFHGDYEINIGKHVFPTQKFRLIKEQLLAEGIIQEHEILYPEKATKEQLLSVLEGDYFRDLEGAVHTDRTIRSELPLDKSIVEGCKRTAGGTILCARLALQQGAACHLGGGFHHGFHDHAEGFCYINDVAIAARTITLEQPNLRVAVIDTDVHQGNGTARIFQNDDKVFTFSIHQDLLYPKKEIGDLDVGCYTSIGDQEYLRLLCGAMEQITGVIKPHLAFVVAGVDPYENDKLGELNLTWQGMVEREYMVLKSLAENSIPFVTVTGGGYSRDVSETVGLHVETVKAAIDVLR
ncbi:MAG: histone deacetylase [Sumerlaeia bacterium]